MPVPHFEAVTPTCGAATPKLRGCDAPLWCHMVAPTALGAHLATSGLSGSPHSRYGTRKAATSTLRWGNGTTCWLAGGITTTPTATRRDIWRTSRVDTKVSSQMLAWGPIGGSRLVWRWLEALIERGRSPSERGTTGAGLSSSISSRLRAPTRTSDQDVAPATQKGAPATQDVALATQRGGPAAQDVASAAGDRHASRGRVRGAAHRRCRHGERAHGSQ
jgi:hypothetical protein